MKLRNYPITNNLKLLNQLRETPPTRLAIFEHHKLQLNKLQIVFRKQCQGG